MAVMLIGGTAFATTESAFAGGLVRKKYEEPINFTSKRSGQWILAREFRKLKHGISDSRRERSVTSSRASILRRSMMVMIIDYFFYRPCS